MYDPPGMSGMGLRRVALGVGVMAAAMVAAPGALAAAPATYTVSTVADGAPGTCGAQVGTTESCTTLRAAVDAADANGGDATISLGAGRYVLGGSGGQNDPVDIDQSMTIAGAGSGKTTIAQTDGVDAVLDVESGTVHVNDLEITGGAESGIENEGTLTLTGDLIDGNKVQGNGGGIESVATLTIEQSTITNNNSTGLTGSAGTGSGSGGGGAQASGGGIQSEGSLTVTDSTISDNTARGGAGGSAVNGDAGGGDNATGGGVFLDGNAVFERDTVSGNHVIGGAGGNVTGTGMPGRASYSDGGGVDIAASGDSLVFVNTTITGNTASGGQDGSSPGGGTPGSSSGEGGGVDLSEPGHVALANVTLVGNAASGDANASGGNLYLNGTSETPSTQSLDLADTIIAAGSVSSGGSGANCAVEQSPSLIDLGLNLEDSGASVSECGLAPATDRLVAPGSAEVASTPANHGGFTDTLALMSGSPALGAGGACNDPGNGNAALLVDQRGLPRPSGGPCDIGAFQVQPVTQGQASVTGTAQIGGTLTCTPTGFGPDVSTYGYRWSRAGTTIAGATGSTYKVTPADGGLELFCHVTATGIRGTAAATSAGTAVSGYGIPSVKSKRSVVAKSGRLTLDVACARGLLPCVVALKLSASGRHGAKLATAGFSIRAGHTAAVKLKLKGSGLKLFKRKHGLKAVVAVSYWHLGRYVTVSRKLKLVAASKRRSRR
jgi:hypothetical protein